MNNMNISPSPKAANKIVWKSLRLRFTNKNTAWMKPYDKYTFSFPRHWHVHSFQLVFTHATGHAITGQHLLPEDHKPGRAKKGNFIHTAHFFTSKLKVL